MSGLAEQPWQYWACPWLNYTCLLCWIKTCAASQMLHKSGFETLLLTWLIIRGLMSEMAFRLDYVGNAAFLPPSPCRRHQQDIFSTCQPLDSRICHTTFSNIRSSLFRTAIKTYVIDYSITSLHLSYQGGMVVLN